MYDDHEGGTWANQEWRDDPARRQAAVEHRERQNAAVAEAIPHLQAAYEALRGLHPTEHDPTSRMIQEVSYHTWAALDQAKKIGTGPPNDCEVGNMAAFGVGWTDRQ